MTEQIRNPKLRFRDNKGNDYSPWNLYSIKDVAKMSSGKSKKNENKGRYIIMDMGTVTKNGTMLTHKITPHENDLLKKGDLVMVKDDIGGGHIIGKTIFIPESQKYVLGDHVYRLEPKNYDGLFLHYCINSPIVNRSLKRKVTGSAQLGLNRKSVEEELIKVPCLEEQEKIGGFFSKLDRQIELEEQKLEKLEEQKKGYMQQIFSQKLRFKDENGKDYPLWEIKKLGELYKVVMGQSPKSINYTDDNSHPVLVQGNADIYNGNIFPRMYTKEITKLVKKGDILLTVRAPVGEIGIAQFEACMGRGVCSIEGNKFIYYFLEMFGIQNKWQKLSQGSTFESISGNEVRNIEIPIPSPSEREKISDFFSELDYLINMHSQKVDELKLRKQGFLQKMFV